MLLCCPTRGQRLRDVVECLPDSTVQYESSGNRQRLHAVHLDCDGDALLLQVEQIGGVACHTGRRSCFYRRWTGRDWHTDEPVLKDPETMYGSSNE